MKTAKIITVILLLAVTALAKPPAEPRPGDRLEVRREDRSGFRGSFYRELKLTPEQTKQLEALRKSGARTVQADREKLQRARQKLRQELFRDTPSLTDIEIYKQEIRTLQARELDNMTDEMLSLRKVLTKEQLEIMKRHQEKSFGKSRAEDKRPGWEKAGPPKK